jgi:hypothetical protein
MIMTVVIALVYGGQHWPYIQRFQDVIALVYGGQHWPYIQRFQEGWTGRHPSLALCRWSNANHSYISPASIDPMIYSYYMLPL